MPIFEHKHKRFVQMNKTTTQKAEILLGYMSKMDLSKALCISRGTLYKYLKTSEWNYLHSELIDYMHNKVNESLIKIAYVEGKLHMFFEKKEPVKKFIYPLDR